MGCAISATSAGSSQAERERDDTTGKTHHIVSYRFHGQLAKARHRNPLPEWAHHAPLSVPKRAIFRRGMRVSQGLPVWTCKDQTARRGGGMRVSARLTRLRGWTVQAVRGEVSGAGIRVQSIPKGAVQRMRKMVAFSLTRKSLSGKFLLPVTEAISVPSVQCIRSTTALPSRSLTGRYFCGLPPCHDFPGKQAGRVKGSVPPVRDRDRAGMNGS